MRLRQHRLSGGLIGESGLLAPRWPSPASDAAGTIATSRGRSRAATDAHEVYRTRAGLLGRALAGVVHILDPELVVLMGEGMTEWAFWQPGFDEAFRRHLMPAEATCR